jgi:hypothetical protein
MTGADTEDGEWSDMSSLIGKAKENIFNRKGEMLMEAIVTILIFSILLVTITTMIQTARVITANSMQEATGFQEERLNRAVLASDELNLVNGILSFTSTAAGIYSEHEVRSYDNDDFIVAIFPGAD